MGQKILIESANSVLAFSSTEKQTRNHRSFLELIRMIFGRRNKNVGSIPLVPMKEMMVQQQEHSFYGLN